MAGDSTSKILALEQVARSLNDSGIKWAVCHGLEDYPAGIGRDLDIVVEAPKLIDAVRTTCDCLRNHGWIVLPNLQGWVWWIVAFRTEDDGEIASLQIDLFDHLQWAFTWVVDGPGTDTPLIQRGVFWEDRSACLGKTLILNGLSRGYQAFKDKPHYLKLSDEDAASLIPLLRRISDLDPFETIDLLRKETPGDIDTAFLHLRASARRKAFCSPGKWRRLKSAMLKQWVVNLFPKKGAPIIAITGEKIEAWAAMAEKTFASLVYHQTIVYRDIPRSWREAHLQRRRSCLQCMSIYAGITPPSGLRPDLTIHTQADGSASLCIAASGVETHMDSHLDKETFNQAIMQIFSLLERHR